MAHQRKSRQQPHEAEHFEDGIAEDKLTDQHEKSQSKGSSRGQQSEGVPLAESKGQQSKGVPLAVSAGSMAALGSVCAKLAFSRDLIHATCLHYIPHNGAPIDSCSHPATMLQGLFFISIFLCNALMWTLFTKSLQYFSSSVQATVINTSANFLVTAICGCCLFGETLPVKWWFGSSLMLCGLLLMHRGNSK